MQIPEEVDFPIIKEILGERDRGAAIVATGFLEAKLTDAIKACLRDHADTPGNCLDPPALSAPSATRACWASC